MLLIIETGIREDICHSIYRYAKANGYTKLCNKPQWATTKRNEPQRATTINNDP